ncbi:hypothetical protein AGABI2DRAFT_203797 [Agaricus bisporus var. bisporus H97]|uniref:hypothetical protein n=1 Tax=Agaricus bisporus var. bisporus (strain H97 / ATCC MYA-4626 / FGSC 10389) TaxID=936046 RepID=UPI00029F5110|nr:hypothetical protein AGABI2DRAFT_203797 [Agaricus bisporus var. bisporus H97]EKV47021.1 hypothetical protein AGABI2DRAFT_203797 [Agaricus bisporus var. bisporus H97]
MAQNLHSIPPLFGGYPTQTDFIPSIIITVLHVLLLPLFIYRCCHKSSRTVVLNGMIAFAIERSIAFGLRTALTVVPRSEEALNDIEGALEYMQTTIFMAMLPIAQDLAMLIRTILVNATYGSEIAKEIPQLQECLQHPDDGISTTNTLFAKSEWSFSGTTAVIQYDDEELDVDQPRLRFWFRRMHDGMTISFLAVLAIGSAGSCLTIIQRNDPVKTKRNQILRYVAASLSVATLLFMNALVIWARINVPRLNKKATHYVFLISLLLIIPTLYRISIMSQHTTSYYSSEPSSQNDLSSKLIFYFINVLPEWAAVLLCVSINVRQVFQTGLNGDSRWWDETQKEKEKRVMKEREKELRRGDRLVSTPVISMLSRGRIATPLISS